MLVVTISMQENDCKMIRAALCLFGCLVSLIIKYTSHNLRLFSLAATTPWLKQQTCFFFPVYIWYSVLELPWQTTPASSEGPQLLLSMKLLWEQLSRSVSAPVHWKSLTVGDWEGSLNVPLVIAIAPVYVCVCMCVCVCVCLRVFLLRRVAGNLSFALWAREKNLLLFLSYSSLEALVCVCYTM